jgi:hypothetical protein
MNDIVKTIRVGTVDFFGVIVPGILVIAMCGLGFLAPMLSLIMDVSDVPFDPSSVAPNVVIIAVISLVVFAYVLGYILRLSSPDELDRISARHVITEEKKMGTNLSADDWPYNPEDRNDKYPYFNFRNYLIRRGHEHLTRELVTWGHDDDSSAGKTWLDKGADKKPVKITKRSKSTVNKMKMSVRLHCPELNGLLESKEGHIRLMAGAWAAFSLSMRFVGLSLVVLAVAVGVRYSSPLFFTRFSHQDYFVYIFIDLCLTAVMYLSNRRIEKLFHYRRVSELFHIVQAAYFAKQAQEDKRKAAVNHPVNPQGS